MTNGPDFSKKTIETLAKRAAQCCSNPVCHSKTSGAHSDPGKAVNRGQAAHIRGARPKSARYDPSMTDEERSHISNGIHLCMRCATEIDKDEKKYPPKLLHIWKEIHEDQVQKVKASYDITSREEFQRLQRENDELRQQLKAKEIWENRKKQYQLVETNAGDKVWKYFGSPAHYACPKCFEEEHMHILQGPYVARCPNCKADFKINRHPRLLTRSQIWPGTPSDGTWGGTNV